MRSALLVIAPRDGKLPQCRHLTLMYAANAPKWPPCAMPS